MKKKVILIIAYFFIFNLNANPVSDYWVHVRFTDNEPVKFSVIDSIGQINQSYCKETIYNNHLQYYYTSHYNPKATVFISNYINNTIAIFLDTNENASIFNFAEALYTELKWLKKAGVIDLQDSTINQIKEKLNQIGNGSAGVYDTKLHKADILEGAMEVPSIKVLVDTLKTSTKYDPKKKRSSQYIMVKKNIYHTDSYLISGKKIQQTFSSVVAFRIDWDKKNKALLHLNVREY